MLNEQERERSSMKRRRLLNWLGWGSLGTWLSGVIPFLTSCTPKSGEDAEGFARFVSLPVLDEAGSVLQDYFAKDPVIVVRDPENKNVIYAVNALCTHQQCLVNWQPDKAVFVCPCHGSTFAPDGKYLQGPARNGLETFPTKVRENEVWVKAD
jgi:cytochrome b6-f complex iron-sulfur subunit